MSARAWFVALRGFQPRKDSVEQAEPAGDGDVLVDVGPMDSGPWPDESPVAPLFGGRIAEAWKPLEGHGQGASVLQVHDEGVGEEFVRDRLLPDGRPTPTV